MKTLLSKISEKIKKTLSAIKHLEQRIPTIDDIGNPIWNEK